MNSDKFKTEVDTLNSFFETYCDSNSHKHRTLKTFTCRHKEFTCKVESNLCPICYDLIKYSLLRLQECPHEVKPRCRQCPNPCYEKDEWKKLAKVMRYSGLRLGILKVKEKVRSVFQKR